jgi:hypothetical protein
MIGVWPVSTLATDAGAGVQSTAWAFRMIHPLFTQYNEDFGNRLTAGCSANDFATYGASVAKAIASVVSANGTSIFSQHPLRGWHTPAGE